MGNATRRSATRWINGTTRRNATTRNATTRNANWTTRNETRCYDWWTTRNATTSSTNATRCKGKKSTKMMRLICVFLDFKKTSSLLSRNEICFLRENINNKTDFLREEYLF